MFDRAKFTLAASLLLCAGIATWAQSPEKEHVAVLELGGAGFWNIKDGTSPSRGRPLTPLQLAALEVCSTYMKKVFDNADDVIHGS